MKKAIILTILFLVLKAATYTQEQNLEVIGFLGGENLYYLYTSIGLLADSYYGSIYDSGFARKMAGNVSLSARKSRETFRKISDSVKLSPEDRQLAMSIIDAYDKIINEADAFQSSVDVNSQETRDTFKRYKESAWEKIRVIWKSPD